LLTTTLALLTGPVGAGCSRREVGPEERPLPVRTKEATTRTVREKVSYVGTVRARREVTVLARVQGRVSELPVEEGEEVGAGQIVARLVSPELSAAHQKTRAEVARARAEKRYRCRWFEVHRGLEEKGVLSRAKADASRRACAAAEASLRAARAARRQMAERRAKAVERAPFEGTVLQWVAEPGQNMLPGRPILLLGRRGKEVRVWVTEDDISRGVEKGTPVILKASGAPLRAEVSRVARRAVGKARLFEVGVSLPGKRSARFLHGSSVTVEIVLRQQRGVVVPVEAVRRERNGPSVYVVRDERAERVSVQVGLRDDRWVRVRGEIAAGDVVAVSNLSSLRHGLAVFPVSEIGARR
jgi:RND family efflux transporter MFP subunit